MPTDLRVTFAVLRLRVLSLEATLRLLGRLAALAWLLLFLYWVCPYRSPPESCGLGGSPMRAADSG